jgi:hypothetical protein
VSALHCRSSLDAGRRRRSKGLRRPRRPIGASPFFPSAALLSAGGRKTRTAFIHKAFRRFASRLPPTGSGSEKRARNIRKDPHAPGVQPTCQSKQSVGLRRSLSWLFKQLAIRRTLAVEAITGALGPGGGASRKMMQRKSTCPRPLPAPATRPEAATTTGSPHARSMQILPGGCRSPRHVGPDAWERIGRGSVRRPGGRTLGR